MSSVVGNQVSGSLYGSRDRSIYIGGSTRIPTFYLYSMFYLCSILPKVIPNNVLYPIHIPIPIPIFLFCHMTRLVWLCFAFELPFSFSLSVSFTILFFVFNMYILTLALQVYCLMFTRLLLLCTQILDPSFSFSVSFHVSYLISTMHKDQYTLPNIT